MSHLNRRTLSPNDISIPPSSSTVSVRALVSFNNLVVPSELFLSRAPGTKEDGPLLPLVVPGHAFLVEHPPRGQKVLFDLGVRKDKNKHAPAMLKAIGDYEVDVEKDTAEQLAERNVDLTSINAVIWSHTHFDHTGDISTFPKSTSLVVGPGAKDNVLPGYPTDADAHYPETDFAGREVQEITFTSSSPTIGSFKAHDYFDDGSFYLLDTPGHCIGHMAGLARVTPNSFVLFAGDASHHVAQLRPSPFMTLPNELQARLPTALKDVGAPVFDTPFFAPPTAERSVHADRQQAAHTTQELQAFDARDDVFVVLSHDTTLDGVLPLFPKQLDNWKEEKIKEKTFWAFLNEDNIGNWWSKE